MTNFSRKLIFIFLSLLFVTPLLLLNLQKDFSLLAEDNSQNISIKKEQITPDMETLYKIKRGIEKIEGLIANIQGRKAKVSYLTHLSEVRLSELYYLAGENKDSYIETSSSRYITNVGQLSETINGDKSFNNQIKEALGNQPKILSNLVQRYQTGTSNWLLVKQAEDTSNSFLSSLDN